MKFYLTTNQSRYGYIKTSRMCKRGNTKAFQKELKNKEDF